jgi:hypothetical protein
LESRHRRFPIGLDKSPPVCNYLGMNTHSKCLPAAIAALAVLLSACASASDNGRSFGSSSCAAPGDAVTAEAVTQYLKGLTPKPQRFLIQSSGDSALPDAAREVLQNTGPTYLFPGDTAKQQTVLAMLTEKGPFPTLLVLYGGMEPADGGRAVVRLSGRYTTGESVGPAPSKALYFDCKEKQWTFASSADQKTT